MVVENEALYAPSVRLEGEFCINTMIAAEKHAALNMGEPINELDYPPKYRDLVVAFLDNEIDLVTASMIAMKRESQRNINPNNE